MATLITPWARNVFTDIFASNMNFQAHPECATRELEVVDCLEAYGVIMGKTKCRILLDDFRECVLKGKQVARITIMRNERIRQLTDGERTYENVFAEAPPMDSY